MLTSSIRYGNICTTSYITCIYRTKMIWLTNDVNSIHYYQNIKTSKLHILPDPVRAWSREVQAGCITGLMFNDVTDRVTYTSVSQPAPAPAPLALSEAVGRQKCEYSRMNFYYGILKLPIPRPTDEC